MISNEKVISYTFVVLIEICNFGFDRFSTHGHMKNLNFKMLRL
jgi:hypothetical protein